MSAQFTYGERIDLEKSAHDAGFDNVANAADFAEARLTSPDSRLVVIARPLQGGIELELNDSRIAADLLSAGAAESPRGRPVAADHAMLSAMLADAWKLSRALPDAPLKRYQAKLAKLETEAEAGAAHFATEAMRAAKVRIGQEEFRAALMNYWGERCAVTGVTQPQLLRASHMKAWAECDSDAERLDVFNGLLLTADWDAAFDKHLVTFEDDGAAIFSPALGADARARLGDGRIRRDRPLTEQHRRYLDWHRQCVSAART